MQTRTVINKVRWIRSLLSDGLEEWLLLRSTATEMHRGGSVEMIHDASLFAELISRDAAAVQIVRAFHLNLLVDREEFIKRLSWLLSPERHQGMEDDSDSDRKGKGPEDPTSMAWRIMIDSVEAIEKLTIPEEMQTPELPETIISFELASIAAENTPLSRLTKATAFAEEAYETVCRAYKIEGSGTLAVVKVESGSDIRIDCKGLGEPIKHLKDLILEAWHKLRHKRVEEILENNKAVLDSLAVMEQINARERDKSLSPEEAEQLRRKIFTSVCGLFECGVLIAEIPSQETVENTELLGGFVPKLLPPPRAGSNARTKKAARKKAARKKAARKKTTPKKRSSTRRKT